MSAWSTEEFKFSLALAQQVDGKNVPYNAGDLGWEPGLGRSLQGKGMCFTTPVLFIEFHGQRFLAGTIVQRSQELDMTKASYAS